MARLSLSLLGPFQAQLDGRPITTFESDKVRALLAYLAVECARPQPREKLAGLLWPDSPEAVARANLSHVLTNLRNAIGDRNAALPVLLVSRQSIQFCRESDAWVDVSAFAALTGRRDLSSMESAAELYHGRFLDGFSLPDSSTFEEWLLLQQEHLHRLAMQALGHVATEYESQGDLERALPCAWRQLELEPWWESAHRQVMRLLARSGQRDAALAQYQTCGRLPDEELGAAPSAETVRLYEQIRDGKLEAEPVRRRPVKERAAPPISLPGFLTAGKPRAARPVFVSREQELAWLEELLQAALAGRGQVAFVIGGAGRGKTALLHEFARRAVDAYPDLLLALGARDAYAGVGDPYLSFRQALAVLSGDAEAQWAAGVLTADQARRNWDALPEVAAILAERGSGLVGTLLPGRELAARARSAASSDSTWLERLECLADPACTPPAGFEQSHLLEQYAKVLVDLSARRPVLFVLDDLQWADLASISLLFHLGRRIAPGRILIVAAYRPDEVALERDGQRHPLEPVLAELRRSFGDVWLGLAAVDEAEGRQFVDQFLDTQPNALDEAFRQALARRTRGHPLFTVELVRDPKERGHLVRDECGRWVAGVLPDWDTLPARAERITRLPEVLRQVLATASVEVEEFTAQVVARSGSRISGRALALAA